MNSSKLQLTNQALNEIVSLGRLDLGGVEKIFIKEGNILEISDFETSELIHIGSQPDRERPEVIFRDGLFKDSFETVFHGNIGCYKFINCIFQGKFTISKLNRDIEILDECLFKETCTISTNGPIVLKISESKFYNELILSHSFEVISLNKINKDDEEKKGILRFNKCNIQYLDANNVKVKAVEFKDYCVLQYEATFNNLHTTDLKLNNINIGLVFHLKSSQINNFSIDNISTDHRSLKITDNCIINEASVALHQVDFLDIINSTFNKLKLWGKNSATGLINIENIKFKSLLFDDITNYGTISLKNIHAKKGDSLKIKSSSLGKTDFILCDFSKAVLEFENSKITEVFLVETDFPKYVKINGKDNPAQAQLAFGQLQTAFQKQGDTIRALEYHSREIAAHFRNISFFSSNFFTKLNLLFSLISNNFGRSWWLGILFSFSIGALFFFLIIQTAAEYPNIDFNGKMMSAYLKFMNPIRSFEPESLFKKNSENPYLNLNDWAYLFDFFGKIFVTYGYYQTIQAFRRFGRR